MIESLMAAGESGAESAGLLRSAKAGDRAAFEQVVLGHERRVLLTALRLLGRWEDAQDAAQEVFVRLHRYLGRFDDALELAPWLYRMTVNVCRDIAGKRRADAELDPNAADPASGPERSARSAEERRILEAALRRLPEKERAALVLRDLEGLPTREVARILGSSEATVRSQVSSARLRILKLTERYRRERT
jgi:RNA polymerase sigma-70 factor (ECF subfamily)